MLHEVQSILVADDNEATRSVIAMALRGAGYGSVLADSASEAMERLRETPKIAAVLADVVMPEVGGMELARQVRTLRPELPIILMTGHGECVDEVSAFGAIPLLKPFRASMLIRILEDCWA